MAFLGTSDIATLIECCARDIPPEYAERDVSPARLLRAHCLGKGMVNEVLLCTYKPERGATLCEKVFKPEYAARKGLISLRAYAMDADHFTGVLKRNIASSEVARFLGCSSILASSTAGIHEGQFGLFMNKAPGKTPAQWWKRNTDGYSDMDRIVSQLQDNGALTTARAHLQQQLNMLEWVDLLSAQADRHSNNYLVDINPVTGAVQVTGIDNDASFGTAITGVGIISLNALNLQPGWREALLPHTRKQKNASVLDITHLSEAGRKAVRNGLGLQQLSVPQCIDGKIYDVLMSVNPDEYKTRLGLLLPALHVRTALERFHSAREHAISLGQQNRVVRDWQDGAINERNQLMKAACQQQIDRGYPHYILTTPLYLRDFSGLVN